MPEKNKSTSSSIPARKNKEGSRKEAVFQSVKGMHDVLPKDAEWWNFFLKKGYEVADLFDFNFIETPILEPAGLFEAGVGMLTDIVEKEMFVFKTKGGDRLAMRPEGTAGLMRSYLQHHLGYFSIPLKVFHYGPSFRYEQPQAGRYREFHQWDFDIIGDTDPWYDVQVMLAAMALLRGVGIKNVCVKINTVGCKICRPSYRRKLVSYYGGKQKDLCADCKRRLSENPLRLLDCKGENCQGLKEKAPSIFNHLCQSCNTHFKGTLELMEESEIDYEPDQRLVRGIDYYNKTVFEIFPVSGERASSALAAGGRYDYLGEILGGRMVPAVGAAFGVERVIEYLKESKIEIKSKKKPGAFFVLLGAEAKKPGIKLVNDLRLSGVRTMESVGKKSMGAQLKAASKSGAALALIVGQRECFEKTVLLRDMTTGVQETIPMEKIIDETKKRLK